MTIQQLKLGDSASHSKTISETDVYLFGPGTIYLGQELKFTRPVRFGDTVTATCTVSEIRAEKNIVKLDTTCTNQHGEVVLQGMATVMPPQQ